MDKKKAKGAYLGKLRKIVASHVYDLGKQVLDEGIENAEELHEVKLPMHKRAKDVAKEVVDLNTKVKNYLKATKDEVQEVLREGTKQAITALKNDKEDMTNEEDEFFKSLDIDLDDLDDDDWDDSSFDDEIGEESNTEWQGARQWVEAREQHVVVSKLTDDDINAAIILILDQVECPRFKEVYATHREDIISAVRRSVSPLVDEIEAGTGDKLRMVKEMITDVNEEMTPNIGTEDMEEGVVVEVVETELPVEKPIDNTTLVLKDRIYKVINMFLDKVEKVVMQDEEISGILNMADSKIEAVVAYVSAIDNSDPIHVRHAIWNVVTKNTAVPTKQNLCMAFYLGVIPSDLIEQGKKIATIYYSKIV